MWCRGGGGPRLGGRLEVRHLSAGAAMMVSVLSGLLPSFGRPRCLRFQLALALEHPLMAHGLVFGGIGFDLGAVKGNVAQAHQTSLLAQPQNLHKQSRQRIEMNEAEIAEPAVVRLLVAGEHPEGGILPAGPLDQARGWDADAVGVQEQQHHHPRLIGLDPAGISGLVDRIKWPRGPARRPCPAERTPSAAQAATPPARAAAAASAPGSRDGRFWACSWPTLTPRSIAVTRIWAD